MTLLDTLVQTFALDRDQISAMLVAVPLLPLLGAIVNGAFGRRLGPELAALIANGALLGSFVVSVLVGVQLLRGAESVSTPVYTWFDVGTLNVELSLVADRLSGVMILVVTGVGFLIHWYSATYMEHDPGNGRYFSYLNLFVASMLLLVLGDNLVTMFVGWEGVGLCSYLLIGFWYEDREKAAAGTKAFIVNRIGDFGFLIGIFTLFAVFGTTNIPQLKARAQQVAARTAVVDGVTKKGFELPVREGAFAPKADAVQQGGEPAAARGSGFTYHAVLFIALLCLFIGATGKSAQIPLYVWLPDAMAGPTPVSALIHAATMVTAGVYMIGRLSFLFVHVPEVLAIVAVVGVVTALFAALIAFAQNDFKKVLAYSTVSQLGYMFVGVGAGAFADGTYHLVTHAFFKACLFLGSGSVLHALSNDGDIRRMGGLRKVMPQTAWTFLIATIAITGVLPFSGFWSKDGILHAAFASPVLASVAPWLGPAIYVVGTLTALFTAFYMFRVYFIVFEGEYRGDQHPHEAPAGITFPLWALAFLSVAGAVVGTPWAPAFAQFTAPAFTLFPHEGGAHGIDIWPFVVAILVAWAGFGIARAMYGKGLASQDSDPLFAKAPRFARASSAKFWVDEVYETFIIKPLWSFARLMHRFVDALLIDRIVVMGVARLTALTARVTSPFENGDLSRYAALTALAVVGLILWAVAG